MDTDALLLYAAKKMNEDALTRIFDLYAPPIYRYALRLCDDPLRADQIVGDVFSKFLEQLATGSGPAANLRSHLYAIAFRLITADALRAPRMEPVEAGSSQHAGGFATSGSSESRELLAAALRAIKYNLTDDQRHVLFLRFLEGFTLKETAAIIGKKVGNVKVIQNRGVAVLRKALKHQGVEIGDHPLEIADFLSSGLSGSRGDYPTRLLPT